MVSPSTKSSNNDSSAPINISLSVTNLELTKGETYQLFAVISPSTVEQAVSYSSLNENCATVTPQGLVTAIGKGNTVIQAETVNGLIAMCNIEVNIAGGSLLGCVTYSNKVTGTPSYPDSNSYVQLIPIEIDNLPSDYSLLQSFEDYGIYTTTTDTSGNYKLIDIPIGKYRFIYMSNNADWNTSKTSSIFTNREGYIKEIFGENIGNLVLETSFMNQIYWAINYMASTEITITKNSEINKSANVINWKMVM